MLASLDQKFQKLSLSKISKTLLIAVFKMRMSRQFQVFQKVFLLQFQYIQDAKIVEAAKNKVDGKMTYKVVLQCKGEIEKLSDWYRQSLEKGWSIGSVSEGDMGDWSEFYTEAQNESYFLTVYLYQDEGSDNVSIDLNVKALSEGETIVENTGQGAPEDKESTTAE